MLAPSSVFRNSRRTLRIDACALCSGRILPPFRQYATKPVTRFNPAFATRNTKVETLADRERRERHSFYRMLQADKLLPCRLDDANKIIQQFMVNREGDMDPAANARNVAERYKLKVIHLPMLAIPLLRIPGQQSQIAAAVLLACSAAGDLQATLQILYAEYYSTNGYDVPSALAIARLFTPDDVRKCKLMLEKLAEGNDGNAAATGDANAMTLHGKFLELAGKSKEAKYFYEKALEKYDTKIHVGYPHPMALPWLTPWMELAKLEQSQEEPSHGTIKNALEFGALKADDPTAYYQLALLQQERSPSWLAYMSKAAASGDSEAMYKLGQFYLAVNEQPSKYVETGFKNALSFIKDSSSRNYRDFAIEWLRAAALGGHKPAQMEMVQLQEQGGTNPESIKEHLRAILQDPPKGKREEWPDIVKQARKRLEAM